MTAHKHLKERIRARMARTGESYTTARRHVLNALPPAEYLLLGGVQLGWWPGCAWIGAGIAAYGAIYFGFHDWIVHQRLPGRYVARSPYMKRIVQAHRLHHVVETKHGTVSFGFLIAPKPEKLKAELAKRNKAGVRAPR